MDLRTKFKIYLLSNEMDLRQFAEKVGNHHGYICRVMTGHTFPGVQLIEKIEKQTDWVIRKSDFIAMRKKLYGIDAILPKGKRKKKTNQTHKKEE